VDETKLNVVEKITPSSINRDTNPIRGQHTGRHKSDSVQSHGKNRSLPKSALLALPYDYSSQESCICIGETGFLRELGIRCLDCVIMVSFFIISSFLLMNATKGVLGSRF
jgi:hypothetical protein